MPNPMQLVMNMLQNNNNNPMFAQLIQMARKGDKVGIEQFARNFCNERGRNFDTEFPEFMKKFKK